VKFYKDWLADTVRLVD